MKKIYIGICLSLFAINNIASAQISKGGLPWTMSAKGGNITWNNEVKVAFEQPDYAKYLEEDEADAKAGIAKSYRVAATLPTSITLTNSGTFTYLEDGSKIWTLKIHVPEAKALSLYYGTFRLPVGVSYFVTNSNRQQILGAYTSENNSKLDIFSSHEVQGATSILEFNIPADVAIEDIQFEIKKVYAYYRGVSNVEHYSDERDLVKPTNGESSTCHLNALCANAADTQFLVSRAATVRIFGNGGFCSGTLINSLGNDGSQGICQPYLLTASHCEGSNSRDNATFAGLEFRFNYQYNACTGGSLQSYQTRTGAELLSRSNLPSIAGAGNAYVTDFLLLKLSFQVPVGYYLAGWNRNIGIWNREEYDNYYGFHHPSGDYKKMSRGTSLFPTGTFNQNVVANTHWDITYSSGGMSPGSSGSALFDKDGLIVGDLSGGPGGTCDGKEFGTSALYSKISEAWENNFDQTNFPAFAGAPSRLKDWLDPNNTGYITLNATTHDCASMSLSINSAQSNFDNSINIYPNPIVSGTLQVSVNLDDFSDLSIAVFDIKGAIVNNFSIPTVKSGIFSFDVSNLTTGVYLLKFIDNKGFMTSKRIVIAK